MHLHERSLTDSPLASAFVPSWPGVREPKARQWTNEKKRSRSVFTMAEGVQSYEELSANLQDYLQQQQQVEQLLLEDPDNADLQDMYQSLTEVIALTQDLLNEARQQHGTADAGSHQAPEASTSAAAAPVETGVTAAAAPLQSTQIVMPAALNAPDTAVASYAQQIRSAQARAALAGAAAAEHAIGAKCVAVYSADGQWYPATVESVTPNGNFVVRFDGYDNEEEVVPENVRPPEEAVEVYTGVAAPKRRRVDEQQVTKEMPKWLEINPTDDDKTVQRKKKLIKSYKSKMRFQEMDMAQKAKKDNWQSFLSGKATKKKTGFFTGRKKESMFAVPDNGKVGVIGSGKGMTEVKKRGRHEFKLDDS